MVISTPVGSTTNHSLQAHLWCRQSRIKKYAKQFQPHLSFKPCPARCLQPPPPGLLKQACARLSNDRVGMIWLLKYEEATRTHMSAHPAQERDFVLGMDQDETTCHRIKIVVQRDRQDVPTDERHIWQISRPNTRPGGLQNRRIPVYSYNGPMWANHLRKQERHIPSSAADLQYLHSRGNPGIHTHSSGERGKKFALSLQSPCFLRRRKLVGRSRLFALTHLFVSPPFASVPFVSFVLNP